MVRTARRRGLGSRSSPSIGWLFLAFRTLALCLALQLSGAVHFAVDLWQSGEAAADHCDDCPDDEEGRECPPGCPSCHCTNVSPVLPSPSGPPALAVVLPLFEVAWGPHESGTPPSPSPRSLYRPPRV